jgi:hypothetical protein
MVVGTQAQQKVCCSRLLVISSASGVVSMLYGMERRHKVAGSIVVVCLTLVRVAFKDNRLCAVTALPALSVEEE